MCRGSLFVPRVNENIPSKNTILPTMSKYRYRKNVPWIDSISTHKYALPESRQRIPIGIPMEKRESYMFRFTQFPLVFAWRFPIHLCVFPCNK